VKKITYIISDVSKSLAFEWIAEALNKEKYLLSFILLNRENTLLEDFIRTHGFEVHRVACGGKKDWPKAIGKTYRLLKKIKPAIVHCHLIQANIVGLSAAKLAGIKKRIYTRHHSSLHHVYFPKGVWLDKWSNKMATHIVAISEGVKKILRDWEKVPERKIVLIPHGFLLKDFSDVDDSRTSACRNRLGLEEGKFVVGVISRFTEWKGVQFIIRGFKEFLEKEPNAFLVLFNAKGDYEQQINKELEGLPESSFKTILFENDIAACYRLMNAFVHVPIDEHSEAFGQVYVEALAAGVPSVFTLSGIANDFIRDQHNALVVPFKNPAAIALALQKITTDKSLCDTLVENGKKDVAALFGIKKMIDSLERLYEN
jgi:glycosyltransferase involved in cell wall biosynthesis